MLFFINYNNPQPLPTIFCWIHSSIILRDYFKRAIFSRHGLLEIHMSTNPTIYPFFFTHNSLKTNWGSQWPVWRYNIALNWKCVKIFFFSPHYGETLQQWRFLRNISVDLHHTAIKTLNTAFLVHYMYNEAVKLRTLCFRGWWRGSVFSWSEKNVKSESRGATF